MKTAIKRVTGILLSLCVLLGASANGLPLDQTGMLSHTKAFYINDYADVLSGEEESILLESSMSLQSAADGTQLVLVTVPAPLSENMQAYAEQLLTLWDVGRASSHNGVLVLVCLDPVQVVIASGSFFLPSMEAFEQSGFVDNAVMPVLQQGEVNSGLWLLYQALYERLCQAYGLDPATVSKGTLTPTPPIDTHSHAVVWAGLGCIVFFACLVGYLLLRKQNHPLED